MAYAKKSAALKDDYQAVVVIWDNTGGNISDDCHRCSMKTSSNSFIKMEARARFRSDTLSSLDLSRLMRKAKKVPIMPTNGRQVARWERLFYFFKGLENAKIFGQPTASHTTGNNYYQLCDGAVLLFDYPSILRSHGQAFYENEAPARYHCLWLKGQMVE